MPTASTCMSADPVRLRPPDQLTHPLDRTFEKLARSARCRWWTLVTNGWRVSSVSHCNRPTGQIFLLGDNRDLNPDSRQFGTVPLSDHVGNAGQIWFSSGNNGVRWDRLGKVLE